MKRKGFTLVELLAVIVILAIILLIAVPNILNAIDTAKKGAFEASAKIAFKAVEYETMLDKSKTSGNLSELSTFDAKKLTGTWKIEDKKVYICDITDGNYSVTGCVTESDSLVIGNDNTPKIMLNSENMEIDQNGSVSINSSDYNLFNEGDNEVSVTVNGVNVNLPHVITFQAYGEGVITIVYTLENGNSVTRTVTITNNVVNADTTGANKPDLASNMIPVKWNGTSWIKADVNNEDGVNKWYDYNEKMWANSVTVTEASRSNYLSSNVGTVINMSDIVQMYVWIPRYKYTMLSGYHSSTAGEFDIKFENEKETTGVNDNTTPCTSGTYCIHPAFISFNARGLWVGKFESSNTVSDIKIKPNEISLRSVTASNMFDASKNINNVSNNSGFNTNDDIVDPHMMKNSEWGAVSYLTNSKYGKNSEVWINSNNQYKTGCAGTSVSSSASDVCNTYESPDGVKASTTGTIYGIYDMSGGAYEYMAANLGTNSYPSYPNANKSLKDNLNTKYVDNMSIYSLEGTKGMAMYETSTSSSGNTSWNSDYSYFVTSSLPVVNRGGSFSSTTTAGLFYFYGDSGAANSYYGFRVVVAL